MTSRSDNPTFGDYNDLIGQILEFYRSWFDVILDRGTPLSVRVEFFDVMMTIVRALFVIVDKMCENRSMSYGEMLRMRSDERLRADEIDLFLMARGMYETRRRRLTEIIDSCDPLRTALDDAGLSLPGEAS